MDSSIHELDNPLVIPDSDVIARLLTLSLSYSDIRGLSMVGYSKPESLPLLLNLDCSMISFWGAQQL